MATITVRNLSAETHRALKIRAARHNRSTEAEIRVILEAAALPSERVKVGSQLALLAPTFDDIDFSTIRDSSSVEPADFE